MKRACDFIVKYRYVIFGVFVAAFIVCIILAPRVKANYDITKYLPEDMETRQALTVIEKEFGLNSSVNVMVKGIDKAEAQTLAKALKVKYVASSSVRHEGGNALISLMVEGGDYSDSAQSVVASVKTILAERGISFYINGSAVGGSSMQAGIAREMLIIMVIAVVIVLAILLLTSRSWFEPIVFLLVIGVSIIINQGTNILLGEISYITKSIAAILQLALAMDYSIVLLHAYQKQVDNGLAPKQAASLALKESFKPIICSSLTTIAGLMALVFMSFTIGRDIGIVMSKGIIASMLTVFLLMPGVLVLFNKPLKKLKHKPINLGGDIISRGVIKSRLVLPFVFIALIITGATLQSFNTYSFTESQGGGDNEIIAQAFGANESLILLVPKATTNLDQVKQQNIVKKLSEITVEGKNVFSSAVTHATALEAAGGSLAPDIVKEKLNVTFNGDTYSRIIASFNVTGLSGKQLETFINSVKGALSVEYDGTLIAGGAMSQYDIATSFNSDLLVTNLITIIAILLIIGLTFKSLLLPVVLVTVIQGAIWIAMSFAFIASTPIFFMSYIITSAVLMGATIDYAILMTNNYMLARKTLDTNGSVKYAIKNSLATIFTSGLIFVIAGFVVGFVSTSTAISTIGMLLGRGSLISLLLVIFLLPQLLYLLDKPIKLLTFNRKSNKKPLTNNCNNDKI